MEQQQLASPSLSDSIFEDEVKDANKGAQKNEGRQRVVNPDEVAKYSTDPDPRARVRWERKRVIQMVRKQTAAEEASDFDKRAARILRSEQKLTHRSPPLETSMKKLVHLARQIQGKTLADAMLQMTYSKKKMATEVKYHLELARDMAIVSRGMGLGKATASVGQAAPIKIKTKDGKTHTVTDPTALYVAEAWVNKGHFRAKRMEIKGRGRSGIITSPSTSTLACSVLPAGEPSFADSCHRHLYCPQGGEDQDTRAQRKGGKGGAAEAMGPPSQPPCDCAEALLLMVRLFVHTSQVV